MTYKPQNKNITTGVLSGCRVTANADTKKYDISAGVLYIDEWDGPDGPAGHRLKRLIYDGVTGQTPPTPLTSPFTTVSLEEDLATPGKAKLLEKAGGGGGATPITRRTEVALTAIIHADGAGNISSISADIQLGFWWSQILQDMQIARGGVNQGNLLTANVGAPAKVNKGIGETQKPFFNAANAISDPANITNSIILEQLFIYELQDGSFPAGVTVTDTDFDNYDDGTATPAAVPNNKWTNQEAWFFGQTPSMVRTFGQIIYNTKQEALDAINTAMVVRPANLVDAIRIATVTVKQGTTSLNDANNAITNHITL